MTQMQRLFYIYTLYIQNKINKYQQICQLFLTGIIYE